MGQRMPVAVLTTIEHSLREIGIFTLALNSPSCVILSYDLDPDAGTLFRTLRDSSGHTSRQAIWLEHVCLNCAIRADMVPELSRLAESADVPGVILALPVAAESFPVTHALAQACGPGGALGDLVVLGAVATIIDPGTTEADLLGDSLLAERGLALSAEDRRATGEALANQLEHADLVLLSTNGKPHQNGLALIEHLRAVDSQLITQLSNAEAEQLLNFRHDAVAGERRLHPLHLPAPKPRKDRAVWTMELSSDRPFHPERLMENLTRLGNRPARSRGYFWVPTRPDSVCHWDGVGHQVSIGSFLDDTFPSTAHTRLQFTGVGRWQPEVVRAFEDSLLTPAEMQAGLHSWLGRPDVLEPYLGPRELPER